jgi:hypothetical protein
MSCGCKKKTPVVTNQEQTQNVTIKLTESNQGSTQTQEDLVNKIVDKLNNLDNDNK